MILIVETSRNYNFLTVHRTRYSDGNGVDNAIIVFADMSNTVAQVGPVGMTVGYYKYMGRSWP